MPRQERTKSGTGIYHVMLRGINRTIYSYCLMSNHLHLLVREHKESVSSVMKRLGIAYAYYFNKKYQRNGHLFQDRFRSEPVNTMEYFVTLAIQSLEKSRRNYILKSAKEFGAGIRQLSRLTGVSYGVIQKL